MRAWLLCAALVLTSAAPYRTSVEWIGVGMPLPPEENDTSPASTMPIVVTRPLQLAHGITLQQTGVRISVRPETEEDVPIAWSASPATVHVGAAAGTSPPPEGYASIVLGSQAHPGPAWAIAKLGKPVNAELRIPLYLYDAVDAGCNGIAAAGGVSFDERGVARPQTDPAGSDVYVTGPAKSATVPPAACSGKFVGGDGFTIHTPYGGTWVSRRMTSFSRIRTSAWSNAFTEFSGGSTDGDVLLFKTKSGRIVKVADMSNLSAVVGPYAVSAPGGEFSDAASTPPAVQSENAR
ncbi:MAG: hypothetical protein JOZ38_04590 [Candidatus Eremiobacteraeota bacterium]|nr:hypothetical protein [Candidatus Eremiobacteraeota bacterium]